METPDVVVLGLGFTGLPTALAAAEAGFAVLGLDVSAERVRRIVEAVPGFGLGTASEHAVREAVVGGRLRVSGGGVPRARTHVLCVPTPPDIRGGVDLTALTGAVESVAAVIEAGGLVLVQSTCPPGTVDEHLVPLLEERSGLRAGVDFAVASAPMRVDPGRASHPFREVPRVVGGYTPACAERAVRFVEAIGNPVVEVGSALAAEFVKVFENTFRMVNISLANELAGLCRVHGVDVAEVLRAAGTKPFGFLEHAPSAGAGGDCVPVAARFFSLCASRTGARSPVVDAALAVNDAMPLHTVHRLAEALRANGKALRGSRILVVGVTYKADVPNVRRSAAVTVVEELRRVASVEYHDPHVPRLDLLDGATLHSVALDDVDWSAVDAVVVMTRHRAVDHEALADRGVLTFDCGTGDALKGVRR
ncbi:nucleotide sugar dehydrogenase [Umezawaea endophytica]|uniref:Nucleotide sugar dehydrogenase n=1 Tax=Umezawaea endophytica TaxID=1654476 RepID=A0A9X2VV15_9PSEU|nr:nucleotide sugar dehydrogenase [Umezawaea endophytica]MCS7483260.1 nucleotide sugar dehydrogenase [Umezawaea endophytica]